MLKVKGVTKKFSHLTAVKNLSFEVEQGEVIGLVGQNGAGKSTTFKMILNFLSPDAGEITINWIFTRRTWFIFGYDYQTTGIIFCAIA